MASVGGSALAARIVAQGAQLALFLVAARVLAPADFGVFALAAAVSTLLFVLGAAGWREFILGASDDDRAVDQAITYSILCGYVLTLLGVAVGAVAVIVFRAPVLALLILTLAGTLLIAPLTQTLGALLVRRGAVVSLSVATIVAEIIGLAAGVAGLLVGWNIIALGVAKLVMQLVNLIGVAIAARWRIRLLLNGGFAPQIFEVSRSILSSRLIGYVSGNAATFVVGLFLGISSVGYFRAAERVVSAISEMLFEPLRLLTWMMFRQAADRGVDRLDMREKVVEESRIIFPMMILLSAPVFVCLAVISEDVVGVLLGEKWLPAAPVVTILALAGLLTMPTIATEPLLTINGQIRALPPIALVNAIMTVVVLCVFTQFGLMAAAYARLGAAAFVLVTSLWVQARHADAPWWGAVKLAAPVYTGVIALGITVVGVNYWLTEQGMNMASRLAVEVFLGTIAYFLVILIVRPSFLRTTFWLE